MVSRTAYMRVQAELMPRGDELAWIEQHSGAYRAWVESFARIVDHSPPTITEATLRRLARTRFVTTPRPACQRAAAGRVSRTTARIVRP
jgi:hypothetical protein